ncbi:MAG: aldo/keto reductase [Leptospiraceae bacterium]|nr:MAG: aldo/keto reductase [Leptospiraceae bacterium]
MKISGSASIDGTELYFNKIRKSYPDLITDSWYRKIKGLNFIPSRLGFGSYRVHYQNKEHVDALREALLSGINVIDTACNYGDGASELLIGNVIKELVDAKRIKREEIILITKAGYIQGKNLKLYLEKNFPETVKISDTLYHSIHPEFLEIQLEISLRRLGLETIDVFLLHNPEYYLKVYGDKNIYLKRIEKALYFLEKKREEKIIQYYGISSNTFILPPAHREHTDLKSILNFAPDGFKVVQFPANLLETGYKEKYDNTQSFLDLAKEYHLWTLSNRPFNVIYQNKLYRFARLPNEPEEGEKNPESVMLHLEERLKELESQILSILSDKHFRFDEKYPSPFETIEYYKNYIDDPESIYTFIRSVSFHIQKTVSYIRFLILDNDKKNENKKDMHLKIYDSYLKVLNHILLFLPTYIQYKNHLKMKDIENQLAKLDKRLENLPLTLQVIFILLNDGIDTVLAGMRKVPYVRQLQKIFQIKIPDQKIIAKPKILLNL